MLNPELGQGPPQLVKERWSKWENEENEGTEVKKDDVISRPREFQGMDGRVKHITSHDPGTGCYPSNSGEPAEYLSPFTSAIGGDVTLDARHTTRVQVFAGVQATTMHLCQALLDTGSPASFIQQSKVAFRRLWQKVPAHVRDVRLNFNAELWEPEDIIKLRDLLCKYEHRFSQDGSDLGQVKVDPFRIILKPGAQPVKQRPYRYSPIINEKVQIEIDKLLLAGVLRRSYSNWASPLVVVAKANGGVRLTVNYKKVNQMSVIPKLPIPVVEDILADLKSAKIFSTLDLISGFFQCWIEEDSIPITAVITATGVYEFMAMPQGLSSSPGRFHSVMQRVCDGLERV
ncbi:unnamed protein product [Ectocarpus sp. CCAP 1310/34]|nr:unnamed protein product [Ectocarpus sp. CCAP 1310/34]